jgi:hypothetical protein
MVASSFGAIGGELVIPASPSTFYDWVDLLPVGSDPLVFLEPTRIG